MARNLYFIGTAGSGKSTMVYAFQLWMNSQGLDCVTVNLDPGAEALQYSPDLDVRDYVDLREVMEEEDLGPNGLQVPGRADVEVGRAEVGEENEGPDARQAAAFFSLFFSAFFSSPAALASASGRSMSMTSASGALSPLRKPVLRMRRYPPLRLA